jgi:hypothetical protein
MVGNDGRAAAMDINVSFTGMLPADTAVSAPAELGVSLHPVSKPPNPLEEPQFARDTEAFYVHIPSLPPQDSFVFTLHTRDQDNQRAAEQCKRITEQLFTIIENYSDKLFQSSDDLEAAVSLFPAFRSYRQKIGNFYSPGRVSSRHKRTEIYYLSEEERRAGSFYGDVLSSTEGVLQEAYDIQSPLLAPIVRYVTEEGTDLRGIIPANASAIFEVGEDGRLAIPKDYNASDPDAEGS